MHLIALYLRASIGQHRAIKEQLRQLNEVAQRLGWTSVCTITHRDTAYVGGHDFGSTLRVLASV